jgi:hypothetical protein
MVFKIKMYIHFDFTKVMDLLETILNPILPHPNDRLKFLRFLKTMRDSKKSEDLMLCVITGRGGTGKSTLVKLAQIAIGSGNYIKVPSEMITDKKVYNIKERDLRFLRREAKLVWTEIDPHTDAEPCLLGIGYMFAHPEKFGKKHFFIQGDFDFLNPYPSSLIHIHLDNKVHILSVTAGKHIHDMFDHQEKEIYQEMEKILNALDPS